MEFSRRGGQSAILAKTRTFIAVDALDAVHVQAQQAIARLRPLAGNVKWVEPENLHWTLSFLGDLRDEEIAEVCRRVGKVVARIESFAVSAWGVGAFPRTDRPRTLWLGVGEGSEVFCQLQAALEADLENLGFRAEKRRFVPHLTLGRVGPGGGGNRLTEELVRLADFDGGQMGVDQVVVYASHLERSGPIYTPFAHLPLG
jgi:2'-5' RNA ligase